MKFRKKPVGDMPLPVDDLEVRVLDKRAAASLVVEHHYLHRRPSISFTQRSSCGGM